MSKRYEVARVGWDGEIALPIILIDKNERESIGVAVRDVVTVKHNANKTLAVVAVQFRDLIKSGKATVSSNLSKLLDCIENDTVEIIGQCSQEEKLAFEQKMRDELRNQFMEHMSQMPPVIPLGRPNGRMIIVGMRPL